ncbi:MAG: VWA domain-containing protein, partial [Pseudomonadota bacterium]
MSELTANFHFLRPDWLWLMLTLPPLLWWLWRRRQSPGQWGQWVDFELQPHVLTEARGGLASADRLRALAVTLVVILVSLALAGPSWHKREVPLFDQDSALVVALDLSRSMRAEDLKPSRLERARLKLLDLLDARPEGQTALVAFAGEPFVVSPLTRDNRTIRLLVPAMEPDIMPVKGSRISSAVSRSLDLLRNAGALNNGRILIMTDGSDEDDAREAGELASGQDVPVSVIGFGSREGAPIPSGGGFIKDRDGDIVTARLDESVLENLATSTGGQYHRMSVDNSDIEAVLPRSLGEDLSETEGKQARWIDSGFWLLLPLLLLCALGFRRGALAVPLVLALSLPSPPAQAFDLDELWLNGNQKGQQAFESERYDEAQAHFNDREWRAAAAYRNGDYTRAADLLKDIETARAQYNRGNALVKMNDANGARAAYRRALHLQPDHADAQHNLKLLDQPPSDQQDQQSGDEGEQGDSGEQDSQGEQQQNSEGQQGQSEESDQQNPNRHQQGQSQQQDPQQNQSESQHDPQNGQQGEQQSEG